MADDDTNTILDAVRGVHESVNKNRDILGSELKEVENRVGRLEDGYKLLTSGTQEAVDHMRRRSKESLETMAGSVKELADGIKEMNKALFASSDSLSNRVLVLEKSIIPDGNVEMAKIGTRFQNIELKFTEIERDAEKREKKAARWFGWTIGTIVVASVTAVVAFIFARLGLPSGH